MHPLTVKKTITASIISAIGIVTVSMASATTLQLKTENNHPYNFCKQANAAHCRNSDVTGKATIKVRAWARCAIKTHLINTFTLEVNNWHDSEAYVLHHKNSALFSTAKNKARDNMFTWIKEPVGHDDWVLASTSNKQLSNWRNAKNATVGGIKDDARYLFLQKNGFKNLYAFENNAALLKALTKGKVNYIITSKQQLANDPHRYQHLHVASGVIKANKLYLAFNKKTQQRIISAFNACAKRIK